MRLAFLTDRRVERALVVAVLAVYGVLAATAMKDKSNTFDEIAHLTAGFAYWTLDDYRMQPENGNWPQRLAAVPAVVRGARFASTESESWRLSDVWAIGDQFFFDQGNNIEQLLFEGRACMTLLGMALGAIVFAWARRLTGRAGGWLALLLFVASPTMLAHGALTTSDMAAALALVASVGALWQVLHRVTLATVLLSALAVSGLMLAKFSGVLILPIAGILVALRFFLGRPLIWRPWRGRTWRIEYGWTRQAPIIAGLAAVHLLVGIAVIWGSYGFRYSAFATDAAGQNLLVNWPKLLGAGRERGNELVVAAIEWARRWHALPEAYLYGFGHTMVFAQQRPSFLNGVVATTGRLSFFPYAFLVKSTIPFILFCVAGLAAWVRLPVFPRRRYQLIPLLVLLVVYGGLALTSDLNIGHRHLLPIYPVLMIMAGATVWWIGRRSPAAGGARTAVLAAIVVLAAWHVAESVSVRPNYLTYFNELVGGPAEGYHHLVDSSLDWGQDLPALKAWLDENRVGRGDPVYFSYFGTAQPFHFGIDATLLPGFLNRRRQPANGPWTGGWYVFSATMLSGVHSSTLGQWTPEMESEYQQVRRMPPESQLQLGEIPEQLRFGRLLNYLRGRTPAALINNTILVFRLTDADMAEALDQ